MIPKVRHNERTGEEREGERKSTKMKRVPIVTYCETSEESQRRAERTTTGESGRGHKTLALTKPHSPGEDPALSRGSGDRVADEVGQKPVALSFPVFVLRITTPTMRFRDLSIVKVCVIGMFDRRGANRRRRAPAQKANDRTSYARLLGK